MKKQKVENSTNRKSFFKKGLALALVAGTMAVGSIGLVGCSAGEKGSDGSTWFSGQDTPFESTGKVGDFYFDTDDYNIYQKGETGWVIISNIKGPQGDVGQTGPQGPQGEPGEPGTPGVPGTPGDPAEDPVIEINDDGYWVINGYVTDVLARGEDGEDGEMPVIEINSDGYWVVNGEPTTIKATGSEGPEGPKGDAGASFLTGKGAPDSTLGNDNDVYLDENSYELYKKTSGAWASIGNIKGDKGDNGDVVITNGPLYGKTILAIGDSYVKGHTSPEADTWISQLATRNSMTKYVYAQNGISVSHATTASSSGLVDMIDMITTNVAKTDYIVLLAGHNDANPSLNGGKAVPIGTNDDNTVTTYKGSLNIIIEALTEKYPTAKILFLTPFNRRAIEEPYVTAMQEVCAKWAIPCFDNYHNSGISWQNAAQKEAYESDSLHFNKAGHERISLMYQSILENNLVIGGNIIDGVGDGDCSCDNTTGGGNSSGSGDNTGTEGGGNGGSEVTPPIGGGEDVGLTFNFISHASGATTRATATYTFTAGQTIDFADVSNGAIYRYAVGPGNNGAATAWIGGGYQTVGTPCTIPTSGLYTIMISKVDETNASMTDAELEAFSTFFVITEAGGGSSGSGTGGTTPETPENPETPESPESTFDDTATEITFDSKTLTVVEDFAEMEFVAGKTLGGPQNVVYSDSVGRAVSQTHVLKVNKNVTYYLTTEAKSAGVSYVAYVFSGAPLSQDSFFEDESVTSYTQSNLVLTSATKYLLIIFKNGGGTADFSSDDLLKLPTYLTTEAPAFEPVWLTEFNNEAQENRAIATISLDTGCVVDFVEDSIWDTYKYAIGPGTKGASTSWIGGSYQNKGTPCTIPSLNTYTIMIAKQDNSAFTEQEIALLKGYMLIKAAE